MVRGLCVARSVCKCVTCLCESLCVSQSLMPRCQGRHEGAEVCDIVHGLCRGLWSYGWAVGDSGFAVLVSPSCVTVAYADQ